MRPPTCRRAGLAMLLALAALASPRLARATSIEDPSTGLRINVAPAGALVCRLLPHESPDAPGCAGLGVLAMEQQMLAARDQPSAVAVIRYDDWGIVLTVKGQPGVKLRSAEQIDDFLGGIREGIAHSALGPAEPMRGDAPGARHDTLKPNGVDVVRATTTFAAPEGSPSHGANHMRVYLAVSKTGAAMLSFAGPPEHAAALADVADRVVESISMADRGVDDFGKSKDYLIGKLVGTVLGVLAPLVAMGIAGVVVLIGARRKKQKEARLGSELRGG